MRNNRLRAVLITAGLSALMLVPSEAKRNNVAAVQPRTATSHKMGGNYYCYPYLRETPPAQTPAPEGYEPFHMEHYSRHGSRWHIGYDHYNQPYEVLSRADRAGKLTPLGKRTLEAVGRIREAAQGRDGELSDLGALQHQGIGRRMARNYPAIFTDSTNLDARSTVVIRSILSMFNGLNGIQSQVPGIRIKSDASRADMWYMNYDDKPVGSFAWGEGSKQLRKEFDARHKQDNEFVGRLVSDVAYARDSIDADRLYSHLMPLLMNCQSHSDQPWLVDEIFTPEEIHSRWVRRNAEWFVLGGNSKLTGNRHPFSQANVLANIIASADTAINSRRPSVNLRYGHDTIILPLAVLMELDDYGQEINDLEELESKGWCDYDIIPMGANIQIVFYRRPGSTSADDVLVKVLLNERETRLPAGHVTGPYYSWKALKEYYGRKIAPYVTARNPMQ